MRIKSVILEAGDSALLINVRISVRVTLVKRDRRLGPLFSIYTCLSSAQYHVRASLIVTLPEEQSTLTYAPRARLSCIIMAHCEWFTGATMNAHE